MRTGEGWGGKAGDRRAQGKILARMGDRPTGAEVRRTGDPGGGRSSLNGGSSALVCVTTGVIYMTRLSSLSSLTCCHVIKIAYAAVY
jgi:hypothetical protein